MFIHVPFWEVLADFTQTHTLPSKLVHQYVHFEETKKKDRQKRYCCIKLGIHLPHTRRRVEIKFCIGVFRR